MGKSAFVSYFSCCNKIFTISFSVLRFMLTYQLNANASIKSNQVSNGFLIPTSFSQCFEAAYCEDLPIVGFFSYKYICMMQEKKASQLCKLYLKGGNKCYRQ